MTRRVNRAIRIMWTELGGPFFAPVLGVATYVVGLGLLCDWTQNHIGMGAAFGVMVGTFIVTGLIWAFIWAWRKAK